MSSRSWPLPFYIAHRGAPQLAPENTLSALKIAKEKGARWVECDIQLTKDNQPVIFHDGTLARTTNGRGLLSSVPLIRLQSLDAGSWFAPAFKNERVPTLMEWLKTAAKLTLGVNFEIKSTTKKNTILLVNNLIDQLQRYWPAHSGKIFISSSNLFALTQVGERAKSLPLGFITHAKINEKTRNELLNANIVSVHQNYKTLDKNYIVLLHENNLRVLAYTVNDAETAEKLKTMGIDGVFTDNHNLFNKA